MVGARRAGKGSIWVSACARQETSYASTINYRHVNLRWLIPRIIKRRYNRMRLDRILRPALATFAADPIAGARDAELLRTLHRGWGNTGFSAMPEYLSAIVTAAVSARGDILECGSGLSTVLLAVAARKSGVRIWSLEHQPKWKSRVERALRNLGQGHRVRIVDAPLRQYEGYSWYDTRGLPVGLQFALVVCDGPPADTPGGRHGLLPLMGAHLMEGATIYVDDAARPDEKAIMRRWSEEEGGTFTVEGKTKAFGIFRPRYRLVDAALTH